MPEVPDDVEDDSTDYEILTGNSFGSTEDFFSGSNSMEIHVGTLIFNELDGYWYQCHYKTWIGPYAFSSNGTTAGYALRKLDTVFDDVESDRNNLYFKGDIIRVDLPYIKGIYRCKVDRVQYYDFTWDVDYRWEKMPDNTPLKLVSIESQIPAGSENTVYTQLEKDLKNDQYSYKGEYNEDDNLRYKVGDIVKISLKAKEGPDCVTYYRKIFDNSSKPGKADSGKLAWKAYTRKFSKTSAYEIGDIVWAYNGGYSYNFKFIKNYDEIISGDGNNWMVYKSFEDGYTEKLDIQ